MAENLDQHTELLNRFVALANDMKNEGADNNVVASALNSSCALFSTYAAVGNGKALNDSGVDKLTDIYRQHMLQVQEMRKKEIMERQEQQQQQ